MGHMTTAAMIEALEAVPRWKLQFHPAELITGILTRIRRRLAAQGYDIHAKLRLDKEPIPADGTWYKCTCDIKDECTTVPRAATVFEFDDGPSVLSLGSWVADATLWPQGPRGGERLRFGMG